MPDNTARVDTGETTDETTDDMAERCHLSCVEYYRQVPRHSRPCGETVEREGIVLYASGSDFPVLLNGAFRLDPATDADRVIDVAQAWFGERKRGWSLGVSSWRDADQDLVAAAVRRGLVPTADTPGMICERRLADGRRPQGVEVRALSSADDRAAYAALLDEAYTSLGMPAGVFSAATSPVADPAPHVVTVGAFEHNTLVSAAQVVLNLGIAGVYGVGTAPQARGRGLAELVTRVVTNIGFDAGAAYVTLQATSMGEPVYRRLGYREIYRFVSYTRFASVPTHN
jgi:ribosomal protein S18 acetylase RimI-like enzyme